MVSGRECEHALKLSERLMAAASLVTPGLVLADIGTDHGFLPIWLVQSGLTPRAVAADVNEGPLERAREHIAAQGLEEKIETRRMDGLAGFCARDGIESIVIAGMGGTLMIRILKEAQEEVLAGCRELILQPQSEIAAVREYLASEGFVIRAEEFILEDGKYYPMMRATRRAEDEPAPSLTPEEARYGPCLLRGAHPVLRLYLEKEKAIQEKILAALGEDPRTGGPDERKAARRAELLGVLELNRRARAVMQEASQEGPQRDEEGGHHG